MRQIKITEEQYLEYVNPNMTKKQVIEQFVNYKIVYTFQNPTSILSENAVNHTVPAQKAKQQIIKKYHLQDWQFNVEKRRGDIEVVLLIPAIDENPQMIATDMEKLGYFFAKGEGIVLYGRKYLRLQFEPRFQPNIANQIRYEGMLIHVTPSENLPSIKKHGLIPSSQNTEFSYPNRIFFLRGNIDTKDILMLARNLVKTDVCAIITINTRNLPDTIQFHVDPNLDEHGVFTEQPIPPQFFVNIVQINLKTKQLINTV